MSDKEKPDTEGGGVSDYLRSIFFKPKVDNDAGEAKHDTEPTTTKTETVSSLKSLPSSISVVQIDKAKFDKLVSAIVAKHPGLVVLTDALAEARELELDETKTMKKLSMAMTKAGIGSLPLMDQCSQAIGQVESEKQAFLAASAKRLDNEVGSMRRNAHELEESSKKLNEQIIALQQQIADQELQRTQLLAQAAEAERVHQEGDAVKLATVAAVAQHFSALQEIVRRSNKGN